MQKAPFGELLLYLLKCCGTSVYSPFSKPYIRKALRLDKIALPRYRAITEARLQKGGDKNVTEDIRLR